MSRNLDALIVLISPRTAPTRRPGQTMLFLRTLLTFMINKVQVLLTLLSNLKVALSILGVVLVLICVLTC